MTNELNHSLIYFMYPFALLFISILSIAKTSNHFFSSRTRGKLPIRFWGGVFFIYIYPNEPSIESLQLMLDPEEKDEIFGKWVFMIRSRIKLI